MVGGGTFPWIRTFASSDALLGFIILAITGASAYFVPGMPAQAKSVMIFMQIAVTGFILWKLAAGLSLYWLASSSVGLVQNLWLKKELRQNRALA